MKTQGKVERIKLEYVEKVEIPPEFKKYVWEYDDKVYLEVLILRVLTYGSFDEIRKIYELYPDETYKVAFKYPEIKRGVKFWMKKWKNS